MKILVVTHGLLAEGLVNSAQLIIGKNDKLSYFSLAADSNIETFENEIETELKGTSEEILCFTDIVNGSPYNIISSLVLTYPNVQHISGVNLSMVLEAVLALDSPINELLSNVQAAGRNSIVDAGNLMRQKINEEI